MQLRRTFVLPVIALCIFSAGQSPAQQSAPDARRIVRKAMPMYPEIAKRMNLSGTVKVLATVAPDGSVKDVRPMGGSPVLIQAAQDAVYKWKFATAGAESKELLELRFDPIQQ